MLEVNKSRDVMIRLFGNKMPNKINSIFLSLGLCLGLCLNLVGNVYAASNAVTAARIWPAQDYTRITLEATNVLAYKMSVIKNPDRIVIDVEDVDLNQILQSVTDKILASDPYIKQIRVAKFKPGIVRLVVDLKTEVKPSAFILPPAGDYRHRLVLDIYPVKDPLMAMLAQREHLPDMPSAAIDGKQEVSNQVNTVESNRAASDAPQPGLVMEPQLTSPAKVAETPVVTEAVKPPEAVKSTVAEKVKPEENRKESVKKDKFNKEDIRQITIAIDAGHGGEDPGARGATGSHEKDITLMIAKKLKEKIDEETGMRAVLTRDGDYFIPLHGRVVKARKLQADLFVSIHADAFTNSAARGSSVFALSERGATSAGARYLAKKENESDLIGGVSLDDKDPVLARTLLDLSQTATINDSLKLGKAVLGYIGEINTLHKNHVEQAGFAVLKSPDIPSILVETAFISNPEEERKLGDDAYQDKLVTSILAGIKKYFSTNPALAKTKLALD